MSFGIEPKKLKTLIDLYHPRNHGEQIKYMVYLRGEQELFINLQTSPFQGVSENSMEDRESVFGRNEILPRRQSLLSIFLTSLNSSLIYFPFLFSLALLIYRLIKSGPQQKLYQPLILMTTALVNWLLRSAQELYFYMKWYNDDQEMPEQFCTVIRQNKRMKVQSRQIAVGDLIQFQEGDTIPADGWLIQGVDITVFQRYLSQRIEVQKDSLKRCISHMKLSMQSKQLNSINEIISEKSPALIGGSVVKTGQGRMIVLSVGKLSKRGQFQWLSRQRIGENIVKDKIQKINKEIYKYLLIFSLIYLIVFSEILITRLSSQGIFQNLFSFQQWEHIQISFLLIIFGLPQGFYFSYFIGLICFKIKLRLSEKIRVNYCEHLTKMASVSEICYNRQKNWGKVHYSEWWNEQKYEFHKQFDQQAEKERDLTQQSSIEAGNFSQKFGDLMLKSLKLKNSEEPGQPYFASPVSIAINNPINDFQMFKEILQDQQIYYISDNNKVKFVFMICQTGQKRGEYYLIVKGKSSFILNICQSMIMKSTDEIQQLRGGLLEQIQEVAVQMNKRLVTTHGLCFKKISNNLVQTAIDAIIKKTLTFLCLLGVNSNKDHSQYEIVRKIKQAAINLVLVSSKSSNQSIIRSRSIGINTIDEQNLALQGKQFLKIVGGIICFNCKKSICICQKQETQSPRLKNLQQFKRITRYFKVMSSATYYEKYSLMVGYRNINRFSVFMGIEDEDHPALSNSYLSITSVDSSQELSDSEVYFPNNSLKSLYKFIKWSRHSFQFVRKLLQLFLPASIVAAGVMLVSGLFFRINPFNITQLIWVTLFSCGMIAINLSLQRPQQSQMDQKTQYYGQTHPFIVQTVKKQIVSQSITQIVLLLMLLICGHLFIPQNQDSIDTIIGSNYKAKYFDESKNTVASGLYENPLISIVSYQQTFQKYGIHSRHLTIIYNIYAIMQILNYFNCRKIGSKQKNVLQGIGIHNIIIFCLTLGSHILFIELAGSTAHFYSEGLSINQWMFCIGVSLIVIIIGFIVRFLPDPLEENKNKKRWANKSYNLSVKLVGKSDKFFQFDREEDLQFKPQ